MISDVQELAPGWSLEKCLERYIECQHFIAVGAYEERGDDGSYGDDGIEETIDWLDARAYDAGLKFLSTGGVWKLEEMTGEEKTEWEEAIEREPVDPLWYFLEGNR